MSHQAGDREAGRAACLPVTTALTAFTRDPQVLDAQRRAITRRIEKRN